MIVINYENNEDYKVSKFPGGEIYVRAPLVEDKWPVEIDATLRSSDDIMELLLCVNALNHQGFKDINLIMDYIPYQQQDRVVNEGESYSIQVFANLINSCNFRNVTVLDPHSDVAPSLINNCRVNIGRYNSIIGNVIKKFKPDVLISPDAGAYKKISKIGDTHKIPVIIATKKRIDGEITEGELHGNVSGKRCLVIDDICVGGATFVQLGKLLQDAGASQLGLYVTHGIFSKGIVELSNFYDTIYTSQSIPAPEGVEVI